MRITAVISSLGCGGAERNLLKLSSALADCGHEVILLTLRDDGLDFFQVPSTITRFRADPLSARDCRWFDLFGQRQKRLALRRSLLATRPDVVISFIDTNNIAVLISLQGARIPVLACERINMQHHSIGWRWRLLRHFAYPQAAAVVVQTAEAAARAVKDHPRWRVRLIPNWIEPPPDQIFWPQPIYQVPAADDFGGFQILAVGRLHRQKGHDLLIRAIAVLRERYPHVRLVILGDGPERRSLESLIRDLRLQDQVLLLGSVKDPQTWMLGSDLFILPSRYEGFPTALAEAMSLGCPVISTACPDGPNEMIRHEIDGLLIPPEDVDALIAAIDRLLSNNALRRSLAINAKGISLRFSPSSVLSRWNSLLEDVLC